MELEICTEMLKKFSEKLRAKFPATSRGYSLAKIARLDDAFSHSITDSMKLYIF